MISKIIAIPLCNIFSECVNKWIVKGLPAHLELKSENCFIPDGWVLIEGKLLRRGEDFTAHLIIESKSSNADAIRVCLPTTRKGVFSEVFYLPKDVTTIKLEPMQSKGEFELYDLSLKSVGKWEKNFRMLCRVIAFCEKYSFAFCYRAGLRLHTPILNLPDAYNIVSRFKYFSTSPNYVEWLKEFDELSENDRSLINKHINGWASPPGFKIVINLNKNNELALQQTLDSLEKQLFRNFSVTLLVPQNFLRNNIFSNLPDWVEILQQNLLSVFLPDREVLDWITIVESGVVFVDHSIYWLASIILQEGDTRFIYSDHDYINQDGIRNKPVFKPDWSPELLRSTNYIGTSVTAIRSDVLLKVLDISEFCWQDFDYYDLFLRISEQLKIHEIKHVSAILGHLPFIYTDRKELPVQTNINPVVAHLKRLGISATVETNAENRNKIIYHIPKYQPLISLIIPTRNALDLLKPCVASILELSSYQNFEIIIVDNQSDELATLNYLNDLKQNTKVRILHYDQPFNYSAINNFAVKKSLGEVICLLNNDTQVITSGWLEEMLGHLIQKYVGVVGSKLYYYDGRIQHAGDTVGPGGCANHLHSMIEHDSPGYCNRAILAQDLSAVTAACLMTWRKLYLQLDGLDHVNLAVAFNDVDYCLRVREAGFRVVWTPHAELYHYESVSRGQDTTAEKMKQSRMEANYIRKRWKHVMHHDPFYNSNLSYQRADFSLSHAPMVPKPWKSSIWDLVKKLTK